MRLIELIFIQELAAPPDVVWPWISDAEHLSAWSAVTVTALEPGPEGLPDEAGAIREVRLPIGPLTLRLQERVLEALPPQRFVYSVFRGGMVRYHRGTITLEPTSEGTRLQWVVEMKPAIPGTGWIARRSLSSQFAEGLDTLAGLIAADGAALP